jgi:hypothetical protein
MQSGKAKHANIAGDKGPFTFVFFYIIMLKFSLLKEKKEKSNDIRFFLNYLFII